MLQINSQLSSTLCYPPQTSWTVVANIREYYHIGSINKSPAYLSQFTSWTMKLVRFNLVPDTFIQKRCDVDIKNGLNYKMRHSRIHVHVSLFPSYVGLFLVCLLHIEISPPQRKPPNEFLMAETCCQLCNMHSNKVGLRPLKRHFTELQWQNTKFTCSRDHLSLHNTKGDLIWTFYRLQNPIRSEKLRDKKEAVHRNISWRFLIATKAIRTGISFLRGLNRNTIPMLKLLVLCSRYVV